MIMQLSSRQVFTTPISTPVIIAIASIIIIFIPLFVSMAIITTEQSAFADGLTQEQLSASLGNRKAD
jgi:hypothetical protein